MPTMYLVLFSLALLFNGLAIYRHLKESTKALKFQTEMNNFLKERISALESKERR